MNITATIDNITADGKTVVVFWHLSNDSSSRSQAFPNDVTKAQITTRIQEDVDSANLAITTTESLQDLIGTEVK